MTPADRELAGMLDFLRAAEALKDTLRCATTTGGRTESTAEHTWRLCLMVLLLRDFYPDIDSLKLLEICIVHDLGEAVNGDIPATRQAPDSNKAANERRDLESLAAPLFDGQRARILALWDEYEAAASPEARLAKALDKIETVLQHSQGSNPADFDYGFNLEYGKRYTDQDALTARLRAMIDEVTARRARDNDTL